MESRQSLATRCYTRKVNMFSVEYLNDLKIRIKIQPKMTEFVVHYLRAFASALAVLCFPLNPY